MEPLLPSEVARLVYGYLKKERNEESAECFLKSSPHLTECHQMFNANRNFSTKVNGFNLQDIFDIFGTMCSMINNRVSEAYESKTMIEKLHHLLDVNHIPTKEDKCIETELNVIDKCIGTDLNMIDKCIGDIVNTDNKSTYTTSNIPEHEETGLLEVPLFTDINTDNVLKTKEIDTVSNETSLTIENKTKTFSSPCLSSTTHLLNTNANKSNFSKVEDEESPKFDINKRICSTPAKKIDEAKINFEPTLQFSPKSIQSPFSSDQLKCQQIPEATSLDSMPGLSKENKPKEGSVVVDTTELIDTFLSDKSLLAKIADNINKSIEAQREMDLAQQEGKILDPPTLEKALDSTQSDPQIKNVLDEFLIFNVENTEENAKQSTIKSRLRSAKKKEDVPNKLKNNNMNVPKYIADGVEEYKKNDNNIVLIHEGNVKPSIFQNYELLSNQIILKSNDSNIEQALTFETIGVKQGYDFEGKSNYVKIAPKPSLKPLPAAEKHFFPKRRKRSLEEFSVRSKFRKSNIIIHPPEPVQTPQSIIIEVPNQSSFENQANSNIQTNDVIKLPGVSKVLNTLDESVHDTPDDRLKPPKNKSLSTPRRRSTHIRCLDFSTPQPKNNARDQARSKLFCDTPKRFEKIVEESSSNLHESSSPLPKLQADWGSVNGFESIVKKETNNDIAKRDWDSDIREMVGAGILTSDADGRKTRKKKTPRKKIKPTNDKINSELMSEEQNNSDCSIQINDSQTGQINNSIISEKSCDLNEPNCSTLLQNDQNLLEVQSKISVVSSETSDKEKLCLKKLPSETCIGSNEQKLLKTQNESPSLLEIPDKPTDFYNEPFSVDESNSLRSFNDVKSMDKQNEISISLETPDKITKFYNKQLSVESNSFNNIKSLEKQSKFPISLETPHKMIGLYNEKLNESNTLKNASKILNNPEQSETDIMEQQNKQNQLNVLTEANKLITISTSEIVPEVTKKFQGEDFNMLETFNNHNYIEPLSIKQPEKKANKKTECNNQNLLNQNSANNSSELKSPIKFIQPNKHSLIETPFKCDDAAVDVPETPISKLLREYDPSKLITPLPCTPVHYEDSLTETPLTKVFRETSYLNRPPISPFPPTPGNSRSVDTLFVPLDQDCSKTSNSNNDKINVTKELLTQSYPTSIKNESSLKTIKIKPKPKIPTKTKTKNCMKGKKIEAKKKQVYESVKVELFGSEMSSNTSSDELEINSFKQQKKIVINKKTPKEEKKSGFKPIPKRKSIQSKSFNGIENCSLNESNTKLNESQSIKPTLVKNKKSPLEKNKNLPKIKQLNKSLKPMVHFDDDPVEKSGNLSTNITPFKSINKNISVTQNKILAEIKSERLDSSKCSNINTQLECKQKDEQIKTIQSRIKNENLNISNSSANSEKYDAHKSSKEMSKTSPRVLNNNAKIHNTINQKNKLFERSLDKNQKPNDNEKNTSSKTNVSTSATQSLSFDTQTKQNCISKNNTSSTSHDKSNRSESTITSRDSSMNNTSCVIVENNESKISSKNDNNSFNNLEYLKIAKVYEIITEDDERQMVYLSLSEKFTFLDIPSELISVQPFNSIFSPKITKALDITPEIEPGELDSDSIILPVTSTPKDIVENKISERQNRARRSPSFWEDSVHNYPVKHRNDRHRDIRHRESNRWHNKSYKDSRPSTQFRSNKSRQYDERLPSNKYNRFPRNSYLNTTREFYDDIARNKERFKQKEDKRRSYYDYSINDRKGRDRLEETERFSNSPRMSNNDPQKLNRTEDVKKGTKRPSDRVDYNKTPAKVSKVEHQRLLKNVDVDDFLSVVHGRK